MNKLIVCASAVAFLSVGLPTVAAAVTPEMTTVRPVTQVKQLVLDGGGHAFIGSDHKLYLIVDGKPAPAPAGHYSLANGGCVTVGANAAVDPASFQRLTTMSSHM